MLRTADIILAESDEKLKTAIKAKDIAQISVAQAMLEAACTKIADANKVLSDIQVRRAKLSDSRAKLQNEETSVSQRDDSAKKHKSH